MCTHVGTPPPPSLTHRSFHTFQGTDWQVRTSKPWVPPCSTRREASGARRGNGEASSTWLAPSLRRWPPDSRPARQPCPRYSPHYNLVADCPHGVAHAVHDGDISYPRMAALTQVWPHTERVAPLWEEIARLLYFAPLNTRCGSHSLGGGGDLLKGQASRDGKESHQGGGG